MSTVCQACGGSRLERFYETPSVPVHSCLMVRDRAEALRFPRGDLSLAVCHGCGFIQNVLFDPSVHSYSPDYEETQGFSARFRAFQTELCRDQAERHALRGKTVLEIGCGKGEFLVELCRLADCHGIGIDPSYRPERTASEDRERVRFVQDFYSERTKDLRADYVCCRHTLEHIGPVRDFVGMIRGTLEGRGDTVFFLEVPDVERVLRERAFWDIYYEHCSYFTLGSLARLFRRVGFAPTRLWKGFDDQYLMIEASPGDVRSGEHLAAEDDLPRILAEVRSFRDGIAEHFARMRGELARLRAKGRVVLWGSGSKAVSYLNTLGIRDEIEYVVDINPHKHGKFLAGTGHEIASPELLREYRPAGVIVMNPIYVPEIRASLEAMGLAPEVTAV
ncbi:MAG: methyltransferase domain-containing protein [Planctomycetes bacterium]|nr:methyltransferase domain-containing protein [Planctomycetota bacterium]